MRRFPCAACGCPSPRSRQAGRARGLASRRPLPALPARMLDDRVRPGEHQDGVTVVESHQVRRLPPPSADLDDLARPLRLAHGVAGPPEPGPDPCLLAPPPPPPFPPPLPPSP